MLQKSHPPNNFRNENNLRKHVPRVRQFTNLRSTFSPSIDNRVREAEKEPKDRSVSSRPYGRGAIDCRGTTGTS